MQHEHVNTMKGASGWEMYEQAQGKGLSIQEQCLSVLITSEHKATSGHEG